MRRLFVAACGLAVGILFILLGVTPVGAVPPLPFTVYGRVQLNGTDVANGTIIRAYVNGVERGSTTSLIHNGQAVYSLNVGDDPNWNPPGNPPASGRVITFTFNGLVANQTATWQAGARQALTLTASGLTQAYQIAAGTDDAFNHDTYCTTNKALFGKGSLQALTTGFRFTSITKPATATVQSAHLVWTANTTATIPFSARLYAQKTATSVTFDCSANRPSQRVKTSAFVTYTVPTWSPGQVYTSPNLAPLLNEVLAAAGSAWDNTFVLLITYAEGGTSTRDPKVYNDDPAGATRLVLTWGAPCSAPGTPSLLAPADGSVTANTKPSFSWSAVSDASRYQVQIDNNATFTSPERSFFYTGTSYTLSVPLAPDTYYWRVRGQNAANGCSAYGPWSISRTLTICATPAAPTLVSPVSGTVTLNGRPTFSWSAVSNASRYQVQIDNNADFTSPERSFFYAGTSYTLSVPLAPGTYYWRVRGQNTANGCSAYGPWSAMWTLTISSSLLRAEATPTWTLTPAPTEAPASFTPTPTPAPTETPAAVLPTPTASATPDEGEAPPSLPPMPTESAPTPAADS